MIFISSFVSLRSHSLTGSFPVSVEKKRVLSGRDAGVVIAEQRIKLDTFVKWDFHTVTATGPEVPSRGRDLELPTYWRK